MVVSNDNNFLSQFGPTLNKSVTSSPLSSCHSIPTTILLDHHHPLNMSNPLQWVPVYHQQLLTMEKWALRHGCVQVLSSWYVFLSFYVSVVTNDYYRFITNGYHYPELYTAPLILPDSSGKIHLTARNIQTFVWCTSRKVPKVLQA